MLLPVTMQHRMAMFAEHGYVWPDDVALFRVDSWVQVMMGQGLMPKRHHGASRMLPTASLTQQLTAFKQSVNNALVQLPEHDAFIKQYCPADKSA